ncbi:hypothetical protein HJ013_24380, partial [Vibrio parahaemolyticus]|nr:hypothetical protein [Vibrio parahaemolyticus]
RHIDALHGVPHEQPLKLVRKSCCLVYKCEGRKLCEDCPRAAKPSVNHAKEQYLTTR